jgi:hypothetical protein
MAAATIPPRREANSIPFSAGAEASYYRYLTRPALARGSDVRTSTAPGPLVSEFQLKARFGVVQKVLAGHV